jgi:hypothetical protein
MGNARKSVSSRGSSNPLPMYRPVASRNHRVARLVLRQRTVETLDPSVSGSGRRREGGLAHDEPVLERALARPRLCVHCEAHRTKLHLGDGMAPIAALRRCGQPGDVTRLRRRQHALERDCRQMVALVDNDLPVAGHEIRDGLPAYQALDHRDTDPAGGAALSRTDLPDLLLFTIVICS